MKAAQPPTPMSRAAWHLVIEPDEQGPFERFARTVLVFIRPSVFCSSGMLADGMPSAISARRCAKPSGSQMLGFTLWEEPGRHSVRGSHVLRH